MINILMIFSQINGLGIGLADMPLTVFTVSELVYHYLKLTCDKQSKEHGDKRDGNKKDDEQKDDDDDASSVGSAEDKLVDQEEMVRPLSMILVCIVCMLALTMAFQLCLLDLQLFDGSVLHLKSLIFAYFKHNERYQSLLYLWR